MRVNLIFLSSSMACSMPRVWRSGCSGEVLEEASRMQSEEGGPAGSQSAAERPEGKGVQCGQLFAAESS